MSDPTITDKAVTAEEIRAYLAEGWEMPRDARRLLEAALPHLAGQPSTTDPVAVDALIAEHAAKFQQVYDQRTAGDHTFTGALAIFAYDLVPLLRRQSADRDTETAALADAVQMVKNCIGHPDTGLTPHSDQIATLRAELAIVREMLIAEHVHTTRHCGHDVGPMEVEGASDCSHCGPYHGATEFCPARCDVVRVEHDHATATRAASLGGGE